MVKHIKGRWLDVNTDDSEKPDVTSRYVGKLFASGFDATLYAVTPPLGAFKLIMGIASGNEGKGLHIMLNDVKRAYLHAEAQRELYVDNPREDPEWTPDVVGRLRLALYGTHDAAVLCQECVSPSTSCQSAS